MAHHPNVILIFLLFCTSAVAQPRFPVKVYINGYKGRLAISGRDSTFFLHRDTTLTVGADISGQYYLNTGATIGDCKVLQTSYIYLYFNKAGLLDSVCPRLSATKGTDRKSLILHTASVTIDPGRYTREWLPSFGVAAGMGKTGFYVGRKTLPLIVGQTYNINTYDAGLYDTCACDTGQKKLTNSRYHGSSFYFTVMKNGRIKMYDLNRASAIACGRKLLFKTVLVTIDPRELSGGATLHMPKFDSQSIPIVKRMRFAFIRGTVNYVYWITGGKKTYFRFLPM